MDTHYDVVIIGAGLSGLAAGIRLAHFDKKVCILESHNRVGGLNSWFVTGKREVSVGLHAMTNYAPKGARGAPLTRLLRQLRVSYDDLHLVPQIQSEIRFPSCSLHFNNDFEFIRSEVEKNFPKSIDGFDKLTAGIEATDDITYDAEPASTIKRIGEYIADPLLRDMLMCPIMFYGCPSEHDMDWTSYCVIWKSIFKSGLALPELGMKSMLDLLAGRYSDSGGELRLKAPVSELLTRDGQVSAIRLETGEVLTGDIVLSSAGRVETMRLCEVGNEYEQDVGKVTIVEMLAYLDQQSGTLGMDSTIVFYSNQDSFSFARPDDLVEWSSGVIASANNYRHTAQPGDGVIRMSLLANFESWYNILGHYDSTKADSVKRNAYREKKQEVIDGMLSELGRQGIAAEGHVTYTDLFTPLTLKRYTGHAAGAVYGSAVKQRRGITPFRNLFMIGADQGFLGIIGSMLSGISLANLHCLSGEQ